VLAVTNAELPDGSGPSQGPALFNVSRDQIRNRDRVRDLAEVYTHHREVTAMLDMAPDMFPTEDDAGKTRSHLASAIMAVLDGPPKSLPYCGT
jgi:hypothetical protein